MVSGAAALLLEASPGLPPRFVKFALQYSAERSEAEDVLVTGSGHLNVLAAIAMPYPELALQIAGEIQVPARIAYEIDGSGSSAATIWRNADQLIWSNTDQIIWSNAGQIIWSNAGRIIWSNADQIIWSNAGQIIWSNADQIIWSNAVQIIWSNAGQIIWSNAGQIIWSNAATAINGE
jgi:hypothetical protein